jgi:hypothetical protein
MGLFILIIIGVSLLGIVIIGVRATDEIVKKAESRLTEEFDFRKSNPNNIDEDKLIRLYKEKKYAYTRSNNLIALTIVLFFCLISALGLGLIF